MEATYAEYEEWSEDGVPETISHQYKRALQQMENRKAFEESLVPILQFFLFFIFNLPSWNSASLLLTISEG